jgi:dihydrouridine synthase duS
LPPGAFTVKCRLGYETPDEFERILPVIASHSPDRVCIHARTVREGYRSPVHPEWVKWAAGMLKCPVVANGNIVDAATAEAWVRLARPAGLMIGRAALRNPWIFSQLHSRFQGHPAADLTFRNVLHYIRRLYERTREMQEHYVEEKHIHRMKKYLVYTARGLPDTFDHYMKRAKTARDFMRICEDILDNDAPFAPTPPEDTHLFAHFHTLLAQEEACLPPGIQV